MRRGISLALTLLIVMHLVSSAVGEDNVARQITVIPAGTKIELRLKNKQTMRGARGALSNAGFTLVDVRAGDHQIAFDDVASVKQLTAKSHTTRNILIGVGIGVAALGITAGILLRCGPLGCGKRTF
jgi:hypothetical protein